MVGLCVGGLKGLGRALRFCSSQQSVVNTSTIPTEVRRAMLGRWPRQRSGRAASTHMWPRYGKNNTYHGSISRAISKTDLSSYPIDEAPHVPVLLEETLSFFEDRDIEVFVDGTLGAGGHATAMLHAHPEMKCLIGFDVDPTAHRLASARLQAAHARVVPVHLERHEASVGRRSALSNPIATATEALNTEVDVKIEYDVTRLGHGLEDDPHALAFLVRGNFSSMEAVLSRLLLDSFASCRSESEAQASSNDACVRDANSNGVEGGRREPMQGHDPHELEPRSCLGRVDGILLDLGMSSMQVDEAERGFSFLRNGPLDMRMDPQASRSAEDIINTWNEQDIGAMVRELGEERQWRGIAKRIVDARATAPIRTTEDLVKAVGGRRSKNGKHPATRVFQALRIAVNDELESIASTLPSAIEALAPGGRLAVITFHSLEDRIVKWAFRKAAGMAPSDEKLPWYCVPFDRTEADARIKIVTRRPVLASASEQSRNPRSRSAKLRVVERIA